MEGRKALHAKLSKSRRQAHRTQTLVVSADLLAAKSSWLEKIVYIPLLRSVCGNLTTEVSNETAPSII